VNDDLPAHGIDSEDVVEVPIDGILDLHQFRPGDARDVVSDYLDACRDKGVLDLRIIHGKGKGVLRRIVHSLLEDRADVVSFRLASDSGSWGATLVRLVDTAVIEPSASVTDRSGGGSLPRYAVAAAGLALGIVATGCGVAAERPESGAAGASDPAAEAVVVAEDEGGPEVTSLIGVPLFRGLLSDQRRAQLQDNLDAAVADYQAAPGSEDAIIWYGRRLAYLSRYHDAIEVYSRGLELHPDSFKLLRHRGHRYISTRQLDAAVADFERAATLVEGHAVEIEPDGAPNALGIPLSNIHFNIWYHLGLAYYLQGDFEAARDAYVECLKYSDNNDLLVATSDWLYMSYRRLGDASAAAAVLEAITPDMEIIENESYRRRLLMYQGRLAPEELLDIGAEAGPDIAVDIATQGYGVGNWYLVNGDPEAAREVFERILEGASWAAFGYIAAEAELARGVAG